MTSEIPLIHTRTGEEASHESGIFLTISIRITDKIKRTMYLDSEEIKCAGIEGAVDAVRAFFDKNPR